jgi:hypothetical protein
LVFSLSLSLREEHRFREQGAETRRKRKYKEDELHDEETYNLYSDNGDHNYTN